MSSRVEGPGGRIVVDPEELRQVATRMRGAALLLSGIGRDLARRDLPAMPPGLSLLVTESVSRANSELQDLAAELIRDAGTLFARATWAELGGGDTIAWLIPGLNYYPAGLPAAAAPTPATVLPPVTEEQILAREQWALDMLDGMQDSMDPLHDDAFGSDLSRFADEYADEIPVKALGKITLLAGLALDAYEPREERIGEALASTGMSVVGGAEGGLLGVLACQAVFAPTGVGLVACLEAGGMGGEHMGARS